MIRSSGLLVLIGGVAALLGMNGLEHAAHLANPGRRDLAEDVAIEMHHAALVAPLRQEIRDALDKASACVGNDQPHALEAAVDQMTQKCRPAGFCSRRHSSSLGSRSSSIRSLPPMSKTAVNHSLALAAGHHPKRGGRNQARQ
jgi:hypothetical protein